jgi:hypothetical protein
MFLIPSAQTEYITSWCSVCSVCFYSTLTAFFFFKGETRFLLGISSNTYIQLFSTWKIYLLKHVHLWRNMSLQTNQIQLEMWWIFVMKPLSVFLIWHHSKSCFYPSQICAEDYADTSELFRVSLCFVLKKYSFKIHTAESLTWQFLLNPLSKCRIYIYIWINVTITVKTDIIWISCRSCSPILLILSK